MSKPAQIIGIDASRAVGRVRTGTENYSAQLIRAMISEPTDYSWRLYLNGGADDLLLPEAKHAEIRDIPGNRLWTHRTLSMELWRHKVNGLFVPAHVVPLYHPPTVVTIHDLGYLHWPEAHPRNQVRMLDLTTRWSAKTSRHIIVPSGQTAEDLIRFYEVPESKITIIHHGVDAAMTTIETKNDTTLRARYGLDRPYVLAVGTIQPRKNLGVLANAMLNLDSHLNLDLVIAGRKGWMHEQVLDELLQVGLGDRLKVLDYVPADDLAPLYRQADVFVQPSKFEGFGMPVLEAMACGTPVVSARGSSLDEIGGHAAVRFDHDNAHELTEAIQSLLNNSDTNDVFIQRGLAHSSAFSWEQTARKTRIVLEDNLLK